MPFPFSRDELADMLVEYARTDDPTSLVTRDKVDAVIEAVREDGKLVYADPGQANLLLEAVLIKIAGSVIAGLIAKAAVSGGKWAWKRWIGRPATEVATELGAPPGHVNQSIVVNVVVFVQQQKAEQIEQRLEAAGLLPDDQSQESNG